MDGFDGTLVGDLWQHAIVIQERVDHVPKSWLECVYNAFFAWLGASWFVDGSVGWMSSMGRESQKLRASKIKFYNHWKELTFSEEVVLGCHFVCSSYRPHSSILYALQPFYGA
jgi:hypothetical protein